MRFGSPFRSVSIGPQSKGEIKYDPLMKEFSDLALDRNGDGTFGPKADFVSAGAEEDMLRVSVADFNNDGNQDIVTAVELESVISVLLGNGDGTFGAHTDFTVDENPQLAIVGDFDHDGNLDVITNNGGDPFTISILLGNGDGTFGPRTDIVVGDNPFFMASANIN